MLKTSSIPAATQAVELTDDDLDAVSGGITTRRARRRTVRDTKGMFSVLGVIVANPFVGTKRQKQNRSWKKAARWFD